MKLSNKIGIVAKYVFALMIVFVLASLTISVKAYPDAEYHDEVASGVYTIQAHAYQQSMVFSNLTGYFYIFTPATNFAYVAYDTSGNYITGGNLMTDPFNEYPNKIDFSCDITPDGLRMYVALNIKKGSSGAWDNETRIWYCTFDTSSPVGSGYGDIQVLSTTTIERADFPSAGWEFSHVDIAVPPDGYPVISQWYRTNGASPYDCVLIPSTTQWGFTYDKTKYAQISTINTGEGWGMIGFTSTVTVGLSHWGTNGVSGYYSSGGISADDEALFVIEDTSVFATSGYTGANFNGYNHYTSFSKPTDASLNQYVNVLGSYEKDYVFAWTERLYSGNTRMYVSYYNRTATNSTIWIQEELTGVDMHYWVGFATNDRDAINMFWTNETALTDQGHPIQRAIWNATSGSFQNQGTLSWFRNSNTMANITLDNIQELSFGNQYGLEWTRNNATVSCMAYENSIEMLWFYLDPYFLYQGLVPTVTNGTFTDSEGNSLSAGDWLYEGEIYEFSFDVNNETEAGYFNFTDGDALILIEWNKTTNRVTTNQDSQENKISIVDYHYEDDHWNISFTLGEGIDDKISVDFLWWAQNIYRNLTASGNYVLGLNIYNLGGFTLDRTIVNNAGFYEYGHPLEVWSRYDAGTSYANTSQVYRHLQWWHSQFALNVSDTNVFDSYANTGDVEIHFEYLENGTWQDLIYLQFDIANGAVDAGGVGGNGKAWVRISWNWYARNGTGIMESVKNGNFFVYPDCGDDVTAPMSTAQFWVDLWVDQTNNSRAVGGNFNPYYYGMEQGGFLFWSDWKPLISNNTYAQITAPLRDSTGETIQADQMELLRVSTWVITGSASDTQIWSIEDFKNQDYLLASGRMRGIDKPPIVETLVVDMASSGFLSGLRKAIANLGRTIINALAGAWKTSIGLIDTILEYLGFGEGVFSSLVYVLGEMLDVFNLIVAEFENLITYALSSVTELLRLVVAVAGRIIFTANLFVTTILSFYNAFVSLFTGGWSNVGNIWTQYDILSWVQLFLVAIFPFWELDRISRSDNPLGTVKGDVETIWGLITGVLKVFVFLWDLIQGLFNLIMNIIRG